MNTLLAAHIPCDDAEPTLVLAVVAARCGLKADGSSLGGVADAPTVPEIAAELGMHVAAARRGVRQLEAAGVVRFESSAVHVTAEVLQARWAAKSGVVRLTADMRARSTGGRSWPRTLLLAGFVAGQLDQRGRLVMGHERLGERIGIARRTVQRAIDDAIAAQLVHTWTVPGTWISCYALGPGREVTQGKCGEVAQGKPPASRPPRVAHRQTVAETVEVAQEKASEVAHPTPLEVAHLPPRSGAVPPLEVAQSPPRSGARHPDSESERPSDARAYARGPSQIETGERPADPVKALTVALIDSPYRSKLAPGQRQHECFKRAVRLVPLAMTPELIAELWKRCATAPGVRDPEHLFASLVDRGACRQFLDRRDSLQRHEAAMARGAATRSRERAEGPYDGTDPKPAASVLHLLLSKNFA